MPQWVGRWAGGRINQTKSGTKSYVLRRNVSGRTFCIALGVPTEKEALAELALFEQDPFAYRPRRTRQAEQAVARTPRCVALTPERIDRFVAYLKAEDRTRRYIQAVEHHLHEWSVPLARRDLHGVTLQDIQQTLARWPKARRKRIAVLKAFCSFLRNQGELDPGQDPTRLLKIPPPRPEKAVRAKGYTMEQVEQLYAALPDQAMRDVLCLHAKTGMHASEIDRLSLGQGTVTPCAQGAIAGTVRFLHKTGRIHIVSLDALALAAAQRLQVRGRAPVDSWIRKVVKRLSIKKGVPRVRFGELRHSFATWARTHGTLVRPAEAGVPLEAIAAVLGHQSTRTTSLFYDGTQVPPMVRVPIKLHHPEDPAPLRIARAG